VAAAAVTLQRPGLGGPLPLWAQRRWLELMALNLPEPRGSVVENISLAGRPALRITPRVTPAAGRVVVHLHGGGYTVGSPRTHRSLAAYLARAADAVVYLPKYPLAPEEPYPAALIYGAAACREVAAEHGQFALSGDSAGGGLAAAVTRRLLDEGHAGPVALGLIAPAVDPQSRSSKSRDLVVRTKWGHGSTAKYLGAAHPQDPGFAPLHGSVEGFPPTLVQVGRKEVLYEQDAKFAAKLEESGIDSQFTVFPRLWHVGHAQAGVLKEAHDAVTELGQFMAAHF
jgi:acetyl esterase/lipase